MRKLFLLSIILGLGLMPNRLSASEGFSVIKDLRYSWKNHEPNLKILVPYLSTSSVPAVTFDLNLNQYMGAELMLIVPANHSIYIEAALMTVTERRDTLLWSVDSLRSYYDQPSINLILYSKSWDSQGVSSWVVQTGDNVLVETGSELSEIYRSKGENDRMILASLTILSLMVIFRTYLYRLFHEYFLVSKSIRVRQNFELIAAQSPLSLITIGFIFLYAAFLAGAVLNLGLKLGETSHWVAYFGFLPSSEVQALLVFAIAFGLMILKVPLIGLMARVFGFQKAIEVHFFAYFRLSLLISFFAFSASIVVFVSSLDLAADLWFVVKLVVLIFLLIRLVLMYLILNNNLGVKKLHLISYLCSSEIIPLIIIVKTLLR
ncbi:DUF4271 domain-containing protein [Reichenbachiella agariperforans]|uniref:DUF4271 domain-containing protein n=1 Tax=Reichenbachiella agariperforans TaxID=156994 RepID=A0A1M6WPU5_REIAG|nr:DUF4271 domain-containing protein [Reichenbachiella agariperforans]MBU2914769.1 DUF4271 domain-containing protein [Reichenbachiella agariperforans]SHK95718.1 protein of unknown function [Reichenbachiella agariperforans]